MVKHPCMAPAGNKSLRLSKASHVKYKYIPTYLTACLTWLFKFEEWVKILSIISNERSVSKDGSPVQFYSILAILR